MAADYDQERLAPLPPTIGSGRGSGRVLATLTGILFLTFLDTTIMSVALAGHAVDPARRRLLAPVGGQRLRPGVRQPHAGLRHLGRPAGPQASDAGWRGRVHRRLACWGPSPLTSASLIAARAIMGVGAAACEPGTLSILRQVYPRARGPRPGPRGLGGHRRAGPGHGAGHRRAFSSVPAAGGPSSGSTWPPASSLSPLALLWVPESSDPQTARFDFAGFLLGPGGAGPHRLRHHRRRELRLCSGARHRPVC